MPALSGRNIFLISIPLLIVVSVLVPRTLSFLPAIFAAITWIGYAISQRKMLLPDKLTVLFFAAISGLSFLSFFWAAFPDNSLSRSISSFGVLFAGLILLTIAEKLPIFETWPVKPFALIVSGITALLGLFLYAEYQFDLPVARIITDNDLMTSFWNRSVVVLAMATLPCIFLLQKTYGMTSAFFIRTSFLIVSIGLPLWMTHSQTAQILLLVALAGYALYFLARKYLLILTAILSVGFMMTAPLIPGVLQKNFAGMEGSSFMTSANMAGRLEVWNFVAEKIQEKPLLGHGVECVRSMQSDEIMPHIQSNSILHPHNGFLQIWVETGLVGALLTSVFFLSILYRISRSNIQNQPLYYGIFVSSLSLLSTGYGLWQSWQMGLLLSVSALCIILARILPPAKS